MRSAASGIRALRALSVDWPGIGPRLAGVIIAVVALTVLIMPLPSFAIDLLLAVSMGAAAGVLLMALVAPDPAQLTAMPPMLVLAGLGRIVLCLCVTRRVLATGAGGALVATVGGAAAAGDPIAGPGILIILIIVQLLMVTGGLSRMAEVAARFALDALPGKQMGLDTAVSSGHLSARDARTEATRLEQEANFYGAMDGAGRLLRGEAVAAAVIVALTAFVGAARSVGAGQPLAQVARDYALLATGHGLVTILPALVMAAAAAVMVSRSAHGSPLVEQVSAQALVNPWPLLAGAAALIGLGLVPGVVKVPTLGAGAMLAVGAWRLYRSSRHGQGQSSSPKSVSALHPVGELVIELGMGLLDLVEDPDGLMKLLPALRQRCSQEIGFDIPPVLVRDSLELGATEYAFVFRSGTLTRGTVRPGRVLAIPPVAGAMPDMGAPAEFADGRAGVWVGPAEAGELAAAGYELMTAEEALAEHMRIALCRHADEILDLERAAAILNQLWREHPALREQAEAAGLGVPLFRHVCGELLRSGIPVRDPLSIVEGIIDALPATTDPEQIALMVRPRLAGMLTDYLTTNGRIRAIILAPKLEDELAEAAQRENGHTVAALMPARADAWVHLLDEVGREHGWGRPIAVICEQRSLLPLQFLCRQARACLIAIRAIDLTPTANIEYVARIEPEQLDRIA